ncbi:DUF4362 domain-containing protein [Halobacillus seohaensis]|uniref:DUF4362 domain-containing protein n=1 Tax=Halobacillus seohaensis TaxID=447421 RepID=A0ABW2ENU6_9BACI
MRFQWIYLLVLLIIAGCSSQIMGISTDSGGYKEKDSDVVESQGQIKNIQYLDDFIKDVDQREKTEVRVIQYTMEGDPIVTDLQFDGEVIKYKHDSTKDQFGSGEVVKSNCSEISRKDRTNETVYELICGEKSLSIDVLTISYDADKQDRFDLKFSYNKSNRVTVDTKEQSLSVQSESNSIKEKGFQFTKEERDQIYKQLVIGNYLGDKNLGDTCREKPDYSLKVMINGVEKSFEWSDCDSGENVDEMTEMAEKIIEIVKETDHYQKVFH